ncbi:monovalent cation/H+ antiporter subunit E [Corynebacterium freiburgense]|uniref:monovalent cation/H+ antiporter subunit E n=1 Tax=Corynebacterium freiburgense TaxID=556548 RepID=UPI00040F6767|nr:monovalent cation/H+ antiporter subunit E [Corynebacterium freiburgense]WJZ01455.1 putative monovalent cation/H+ antiporter subunit E [Corynebacterium freiburgense]
MIHALKYTTWLLTQVFVGAMVICRDVLRRQTRFCPVIVAYPLRVTTDRELAMFSTSVTMTPGTLSLGFRNPVREGDPRVLLVQAVYGADPSEVLAGLTDMEERLAPHVAGIDHGAPGQGAGNPLRSTFVAGHSDTNYGPVSTDPHPTTVDIRDYPEEHQ